MGSVTMLLVAADERDTDELRRTIRTTANRAMREGLQAGMTSSLLSRLRMADKNGDGNLDADELPARYQRYMRQLDTNRDGVIDAKELQALSGRRR